MAGKKNQWPKIGTLRKNDDGNSYIKLEKDVKIFIGDEEVTMNASRTVSLQDPRKQLENMFNKGLVNEKDYEKRQEVLAENAWLRYELVVPPPKV